MDRQKLLIMAKFLINSGILCLLLLCLPALPYWVGNNLYIVLFALALILVGSFQCIIANKHFSKGESGDNHSKHFPMVWHFKTIKWVLIVAAIFHIIAALIILFFYCLKHEFGATLLVTVLVGIAIGFICEVAVPYYKKNKDKPN